MPILKNQNFDTSNLENMNKDTAAYLKFATTPFILLTLVLKLPQRLKFARHW